MMNDQEARDYHRALHDFHDMRLKNLELNRYIASVKSENEKLRKQIKILKSEGTTSEAEQVAELLAMLDEEFPGHRVTQQRKEIHVLHKKIKRLEGEVQ